MYSDTAISNESVLIAYFELCFSTSLIQVCMIFLISAGSSSSLGINNSRVASMAGASNGSEGCLESLVMSGEVLCTLSEIFEMI